VNILDNQVPAAEPLTLEQVRKHLKVDVIDGINPDDDLILWLISAAREHVEQNIQTVIATRAITVTADGFAEDALDLGVWPVKSVTTLRYEMFPGTYSTVPSAYYTLDVYSKPAVLRAVSGWPQSTGRPNSVIVELVAGMDEVPKSLKQAMLLLMGHWYENREAVNIGNITSELPKGVDALLTPHRLGQGV
jgi:uncharacterized phiE125 gp8 family phage protein